jgi:hypothetical protein
MTGESVRRVTTWVVRNSLTGVVVSEWPNQFDALADKERRDEEWREIEPLAESPLVVERRGDA